MNKESVHTCNRSGQTEALMLKGSFGDHRCKDVVGDRLQTARERLNLTQAEFSEMSGIPLNTLKGYELSKRLPGAEAIELMVRVGINANWLLTGEGPMLLADKIGTLPPLHSEELRTALEVIEEALVVTKKSMLPAQKAEIVAVVYKLFLEGEGKIERSTVLALVKSAA